MDLGLGEVQPGLFKLNQLVEKPSPEEAPSNLAIAGRYILSPRIFELGLICRTEDKAEPVIQLSPPLVAGPEEFREIVRILRQAITEAQEIMG